MKKLNLDTILHQTLPTIAKQLNVEIYAFERVTKIYGSNANTFRIKTINSHNKSKTYFLKFIRTGKTHKEVAGSEKLRKFLPTPHIILSSDNLFKPSWILYEHVSGKLFSEIFHLHELKKADYPILEIEKTKENLLCQMYRQTQSSINIKEYLNLTANRLFHRRLVGKRYHEFYTRTNSHISLDFGKQIILNGKPFPQTIEEVFESIKKKYYSFSAISVNSYLGHGDAHSGNILIQKDNSPVFIDNEYCGDLPPFMELAKPYYNDFLGTLFFPFADLLENYFELKNLNKNRSTLSYVVKVKKKLGLRTKITEEKLNQRSAFLKLKTPDFLSLNDYLVMCHTLTRNPNLFPETAKQLFIPLTLLLANFDSFDPESIYSFF